MEQHMLMFLLDCENRFQKEGKWFNLTDNDFMEVGFGSCRSRWRKYRDDLCSKGLIDYRQGHSGKKSEYKVSPDIEDRLQILADTTKIKEELLVEIPQPQKAEEQPTINEMVNELYNSLIQGKSDKEIVDITYYMENKYGVNHLELLNEFDKRIRMESA